MAPIDRLLNKKVSFSDGIDHSYQLATASAIQ